MITTAVLVVAALCGCGKSGVKVSGAVTLDAVPLENGWAEFTPEDLANGPNAGAIIKQGRFSIEPTGNISPGDFVVQIHAWRLTKKKMDGGGGLLVDEIDTKSFSKDRTNSPLVCQLKTGVNKVDFELASSHASPSSRTAKNKQ